MAGAELESKAASEDTQRTSSTKDGPVTSAKDLQRWKVGSRLEARADEESDQWFLARVKELDKAKREILIHYMNWNSKHDEWIPANSSRLRPVRSSARLDASSNGVAPPSVTNSVTSPLPQVSSLTTASDSLQSTLPPSKDFKSGDKVMATWKLNRKFPATIIGVDADTGNILVEFYDKVQSSVRPSQVRRMRRDEEMSHLNSNGEMKTVADEEAEQTVIAAAAVASEADEAHDPEVILAKAKPVTPKGRRERKRKFDVKTLLNLRPASAASSITSAPASPSAVSTPTTTTAASEETTLKTTVTPSKKRQRRSDRVQQELKSPLKSFDKEERPQTTPTAAGISSATVDGVGVLVSGKRERKKKKFWDEEEGHGAAPATPLTSVGSTAKVSKSKTPSQTPSASKSASPTGTSTSLTTTTTTTTTTNKNRRRKSEPVNNSHKENSSKIKHVEQNVTTSETSATTATAATTSTTSAAAASSSTKENGRLKYLMFDLTSDPKLIAEKMIEGVNIPGPGVPIPIESRLPNGWEKRVIQRGIGITKGKWDVFIQNANGRTFRSKTELQRHLDEHRLPHTVDEFDFSLDDRLKRLRQIWKQYIVNKGEARTNRKKKPAMNADGSAAEESKPPSKKKQPPTQLQQLLTQQLVVDVESPSTGSGTPVDVVGGSPPLPPNIGIESETGQGMRCTIDKCGKLFRNDRLLQQHVKHYHPEVFDQVIASTPAGSPPSAGIFADGTPMSDDGTPLSVAEIRRPRKSVSIDMAEADFLSVYKKRKFSLDVVGGGDPDDAGEKQFAKRMRALDRSKRFASGASRSKFSFSESSIASPDVFDWSSAGLPNRSRTDSVLSMDASSVAPSEDGDHEPTRATATNNTHRKLPPTPPTFRISKRRQAQLIGSSGSGENSKRRRSCLHLSDELSTPTTRGHFDNAMSPEMSVMPSTSGSAGGYFPFPSSLAMGSGSSYPPSEVDTSVASEHLTSEEVVNCACRRKEEDGLMIQCDICLCWQHGLCLGIDDEDLVPEKHVCETCKNPRAGRPSAKFAMDTDWLKEGKLPSCRKTSSASSSEATLTADGAFKKLSELMSDLSNLNRVLHSLRLKLQVASQRNSGKVFMWSSIWDKPPSIIAASQQPQSNTALTAACSTAAPTSSSTSFADVNDGFGVDDMSAAFGKLDADAVIEKLKMRLGPAATAAGGEDPFQAVPSESNPDSMMDPVPAFDAATSSTTTTETVTTTAATTGCESTTTTSGVDPSDPSQPLWPHFSLTFDKVNNGDGSNGDANNVEPSDKMDHSELKAEPVDGQPKVHDHDELGTQLTNGDVELDPEQQQQQQRQQDHETLLNDQATDLDAGSGLSMEQHNQGSLDLVDHLVDVSGDVNGDVDEDHFDPSLIPTMSEVAQLLPSVIEAMGSSAEGHDDLQPPPSPPMSHHPPPQPRVLIPEPKRIDRDECRLNLLDHISTVQSELETRLDVIETALESLMSRSSPLPPTLKIRTMLTRLVRDLATARHLMWSLD